MIKLLKRIFHKQKQKHASYMVPLSDIEVRIIDTIIVVGVVLSIILMMLESIPEIASQYWYRIFVADVIIAFIFGAEYFYRLLKASRKREFVFNFLNILDFLSFAPLFVIRAILGSTSHPYFSLLRSFRIFRMFSIFDHTPLLSKLWKWINKHKSEYATIFLLMLTTLLIASSLTYIVENPYNPQFHSLPDAIWWGLVTMTWIGYGDIVPITSLGRLFGSIIMLIWPVMIAILSSLTVVIFLESTDKLKRQSWLHNHWQKCPDCGKYNAPDANYCNWCGAKL